MCLPPTGAGAPPRTALLHEPRSAPPALPLGGGPRLFDRPGPGPAAPREPSALACLAADPLPVAGRLDAGPGRGAEVLRERVALLEERLREQERRALELRGVISTKDHIIRRLGGEAEAATSVVQAKDEIIRELGLELSAARRQAAAAAAQRLEPHPSAAAEPSWPSRPARAPGHAASEGAARFTVLPVGEDTQYVPVPGSLVDARIAAFTNSRPCKVIFTRLEDGDYYLYGRHLVLCRAVGAGVQVELAPPEAAGRGGRVALPLSPPMALEDFVARHEAAEHAYFERAFAGEAESTQVDGWAELAAAVDAGLCA